MANFGELVLVLGDLHIPQRASKIPAAFQRMLVPNKMQHVICTGNISMEQYEELRGLAPNVHVVAGDYDDLEADSPGVVSFPETRVLQVGNLRIGVVHGHQLIPFKSKEAVERMRRKLDVDVIVTGHTHQAQVNVQEDDYYHINPVSSKRSNVPP
jgi:vacuolar protein sorting-associated protein 29